MSNNLLVEFILEIEMSQNTSQHEEIEFFFNIIKNKYGDRLTEEELVEVRKSVEILLETAEAVRKIELDNWDEPFFVFRPYKGEE